MMSVIEGWWACSPHSVHVVLTSDVEGMDEASGLSHESTQTIKIAEGMATTVVVETLLHESVHLWLSSLPLPEDAEEMVATVLGRALTSWLQDNPERVRGLIEMVRLPRKDVTDEKVE